jgi:hypothetical protein
MNERDSALVVRMFGEGGYHIGLTDKLHLRESIIGGRPNIYNRPAATLP